MWFPRDATYYVQTNSHTHIETHTQTHKTHTHTLINTDTHYLYFLSTFAREFLPYVHFSLFGLDEVPLSYDTSEGGYRVSMFCTLSLNIGL